MWKRASFPKDEELDQAMESIGLPVVSEENVADKQRRYIDAHRFHVESRAWTFALISALASVASAAAAWVVACHAK
jgi:hypothetical protein